MNQTSQRDSLLNELPRLYLAQPSEVAERLKATARGRGDTILYEKHAWTIRAVGTGTVEQIPDGWKFSLGRVEELLRALNSMRFSLECSYPKLAWQ